MIIKEVKLVRGFLLFCKEINIITDQGKISFKKDWDSDLIGKINKKLTNFKIESLNDFGRLRNTLKELSTKQYNPLEINLFKSIIDPWRFVDSTVKQVPRPLSVIFTKNIGIHQFVVFSLNAKDFSGALNANRQIADFLAKKIDNTTKQKDEEILMLIKEGIDEILDMVDFEVRVGVVFNNYFNGKYRYEGNELNKEEQYLYIAKLIEKYGVAYVENPFGEDDFDSYKKLLGQYRKICLICMNSKINEYKQGIDKKAFNTVVAKFEDISSFKIDVDSFKDERLNIVVECNPEIVDLFVGLKIPLLKLEDTKIGSEVERTIISISEKIIVKH